MEDAALQKINSLRQKLALSMIPQYVKDKLNDLLDLPGDQFQFERLVSYADFVLSLPFDKYSQDILDLNRAKQILDKNHFGLENVKSRILEYLSVLILNREKAVHFHAPILLFVGLVGSGKTTLAYSIAEALGRKIIRIPFGGLGDPAQLRGQSRVKAEAEPGQVIKGIKNSGVSNPVILLDEVDRVAEEGRIDIMGVLVELLDPQQNQAFVDHYLDFPYDLSQVLFIATANNTSNIATAVMDRLEPILMPSYSDAEKVMIAKNYLLPKVVEESGLARNSLQVSDEVWPMIIRPLGFDGGIRSLDRVLESIVRKIAVQTVAGQKGPFQINLQNIKQYLES